MDGRQRRVRVRAKHSSANGSGAREASVDGSGAAGLVCLDAINKISGSWVRSAGVGEWVQSDARCCQLLWSDFGPH